MNDANAALVFHAAAADPDTLARCAARYAERIGQEPQLGCVENRGAWGWEIAYQIEENANFGIYIEQNRDYN